MAAETDAFLQLNDAELTALERLGVRRAVSAGEYLYREGDPGYDFYVVLAGAVEIVVNAEGGDRVIARHTAVPDGPVPEPSPTRKSVPRRRSSAAV